LLGLETHVAKFNEYHEIELMSMVNEFGIRFTDSVNKSGSV